MFKISLWWHINEQLIASIIYKKLFDLLESKSKSEIFELVKSVKISWEKITITTLKPIANAELSLFKWEIEAMTLGVFRSFWSSRDHLKIILK